MRKLVYEPFGGLCNRLRNMDYIFGVKDSFQLDETVLFWFNDRNCGCNVEDLFSLPVRYQNKSFPKKSIKECRENKDYFGLIVSIRNNILYKSIQKQYQKYLIDDADYQYDSNKMLEVMSKQFGEAGTVYFKGCHNPKHERDYSWLTFNSDIINRSISAVDEQTDYVSVHIRRTDHKQCIFESPTYVFFDFMDGLVAAKDNQKIYLATDDESVYEKAKERYGNHLIPRKPMELSRSSKQGIIDAAVEFLILSRSRKVFGSSSSSYSEEAAYYGKVPFEILTLYNFEDALRNYIDEQA